MAHVTSTSAVSRNENGGMYVRGRQYSLQIKLSVVEARNRLLQLNPEAVPSMVDIAHEAKVSPNYVKKVLMEVSVKGAVVDPVLSLRVARARRRGVSTKLSPEAMLFLLALRAEEDRRPLHEYKSILQDELGVVVSHQTIDTFFKRRFDYRGALRKSSPVPLDKFKPENVERYYDFLSTLQTLPDHFKFHFVDEKHVVNSDCMANRVRADPLSGRVCYIPVSGNFRDAYNLIAIISPNPAKPYPVYWVCGEENGNAASYTVFLELLLAEGWFERGDVLVRDRCAIHDQAEATICEDMLWNAVGEDGNPLHILTVPLPARSPELNPIELVFNILARKLRSYKYSQVEPEDVTVPEQVGRVLSDMETYTIIKCCAHCGY